MHCILSALVVSTFLWVATGAVARAQADARAQPNRAQPGYEKAWRPIIEHEGVAFSFIFYPYADNEHGGVVVRLINRNDYAVDYAFTMVFRDGDGHEETARAEGRLRPGELQTGDRAGLFWIPFMDGRSIGEVGLRGYRVTRRVKRDA